MKILVAGASGQLARSLVAAAESAADVEVLALGRPALDLCAPDTLAHAIDCTGAELVVNTAAYTAVDQAESEPGLAHAVNAEGAAVLAEIAARRGLPIIHISTDYVFDGSLPRPYRETDAPNPISVYGSTKLAGEQRVAAGNPQALILRTSWIYSPYGHNFVKTMLRLAGERPEIKVVADQIGSPTHAGDLAAAVLAIAGRLKRWRGPTAPWGVYHVAGAGSASRHQLAELVVRNATRYGLQPIVIHPIATAELPTPARRPASSRLDCSRLAQVFDLRLAPWEDGVSRCLAQIYASRPAGTAG